MLKRMGLLVVAAVVATGAMASSVSAAGDPPVVTPQIIGGTTVPAPIPWMVALVENGYTPPAGQFCGGTLIHPQWVLTAAHCATAWFIGENPKNLYVVLGKVGLGEYTSKDVRKVAEIIVHPNWNFLALTSDVALLRLKSPVKDAVTIGINRNAAAPALNEPLDTFGWGLVVGNSNLYATDLQHIDQVDRAGPTGACGTFGSQYDSDHHLCGGVPDGSRRVCNGDSGGPIVSNATVPVVVGITSWGWNGCPSGPSVFSRVSSYATWIHSYVPLVPEATAGSASITEGDAQTTVLQVPVTLSDPTIATVKVGYTTVDDTATVADKDYSKKSGTLTFKPGETMKYVEVKIKGDTKVDGATERFGVQLTKAGGATLTSGQGSGLIQDDDEAI